MECATVEKQACTTMTEPVSLIFVMVTVMLIVVIMLVVIAVVMVVVVVVRTVSVMVMMTVILTNLVTNGPIGRSACDVIMCLGKLRHTSHNQCIKTP